MASDLNQCNFIGRLGKDVETRFMPNGEVVSSFSIAVGSTWKDKSGNKQESTEWVNVTAFGKLGEICGEYLKKGSQVFISGRMKTEKYVDKEGVSRESKKIIAERMQMLGSKGGDNQQQDNRQPAQPQQSGGGSSGFDDMDDDPDIPFATASLWRDVTWKKLRWVD